MNQQSLPPADFPMPTPKRLRYWVAAGAGASILLMLGIGCAALTWSVVSPATGFDALAADDGDPLFYNNAESLPAAGPDAAASAKSYVYVQHHDAPTFTTTIEGYDRDGNSLGKGSRTCSGLARSCIPWASWEPPVARVRVHIDSGSQQGDYDFYTSSPGHTYCIPVKAFGEIKYTGDETQGCAAA